MAFQVTPASSQKEIGVTSIEYALMAALIALAAIVGFSLLGGSQGAGWDAWSAKVVEAVAGD
ncbi:Flp family type IVb pilin [Hydrogenophaga sp. PBL-H3]|uniref:Flp family type IVb pilin n=1 Tax=Hydrogenophaga sp. PBL-H3 TaxID=434010 RepID=UPI00131FDEFB|nr:Flp family type IVb pilin [Hydrogenophaga sp. PBL-H3]QHE76502.1 Flp family type IVb pilin [Hydrogenophaga sp. PBL-H3]QHE80926.1 Flp family type IVb pilin [Hydrogenophaga sp. PBL-H3]